MSQSHNPKDTHALLQSMLQRLKLQSGREAQAFPHTPAPVTAASAWGGQDGERGSSNFQKVNNSPVNGFGFGISAADSNFGPKGGEIQQPSQGCEVDRGLISFPSQKDNTDDNRDEKRVLGRAKSPEITPTRTGQLFPATSLKHADITSFERTDGEKGTFGSSAVTRHVPSNKDAVTSMGQNQDQNQGFTSKVYAWSLKPTDASLEAGSEENKMLHMENGEFGTSAQSKDMQFVANSQKTTNSSSRRKQRSSENRTRRWTLKIKERWRDRQGGLGKKGKEEEEGSMEQRSEQASEVSPQNQLLTAEDMINTSNTEEERALPSLNSSDPSKIPPAHTQDSRLEGRFRSYSDFEFGLGSFSLLDEIVTGQEWAKFLNPNHSANSVSQRPSEEPLSQFKIPPNPYDNVHSNQQGAANNQWSFWGTEATPGSNFGITQISPATSLSVSMEVSEGKQGESVHREAEQSEPMDDGHNQSDMQPGKRGLAQQRSPLSFVQLQPADILDKSRAHPNRKRQHQSAERGDERLQIEKEAEREGSISALSMTSSHEMDETRESQHDNVMPLYSLKSSPTPLSPSYCNPFAPAPRSVLKHSISQDSESSMETLTKRRRVEENRRVHFSEEVVAIEPPEVDLDALDSEDDSGAEEDSVIGQECEVVQAPIEVVVPARRHALPAWIQALKRKNTGRKHR